MGQLSALTGAVERVTGAVHADPGTILVLLKNGRPVNVVAPGRRYRGAFRLADMAVLPVRSGQVQVTVPVSDVLTADRYALPRVEVTVTVQVDNRGNYRGLRDVVARDGTAFAEHLDTRLARAVSEITRDTLGDRTHEDLYGKDLSELFAADLLLLDGLFRLVGVDRVDQEWDPVFVETHNAEKEKQRDLVRAEAASAVEAAEDENLLERAQRLGLSPAEIRDPALTARIVEGHQALELERIRSNTELKRAVVENLRDLRRDPELLRVLVTELGEPTDAGTATAPRELVRGDSSASDVRAETPTDLVVDEALLEVLTEAGGDPDDVYGIAGVTADGHTTVLVVTAGGQALSEATRGTFEDGLREATGGDAAVVEHAHHRYLDRFVSGYLQRHLPDLPAGGGEITATVALAGDGGTLTIELPDSSYRSGREALLDPAGRILPPLLAVLPVTFEVAVERA